MIGLANRFDFSFAPLLTNSKSAEVQSESSAVQSDWATTSIGCLSFPLLGGFPPSLKPRLPTLCAWAPTLFALTFASVAHAQGTMDFSGAQTLHGDVQDVRCLCGRCYLFRRLDLRRHTDDERSFPGCHPGPGCSRTWRRRRPFLKGISAARLGCGCRVRPKPSSFQLSLQFGGMGRPRPAPRRHGRGSTDREVPGRWHSDHVQVGKRHVQMFSLKTTPEASRPCLFSGLLTLDCDSVLCSTWRVKSTSAARSEIDAQEKFISFFKVGVLRE